MTNHTNSNPTNQHRYQINANSNHTYHSSNVIITNTRNTCRNNANSNVNPTTNNKHSSFKNLNIIAPNNNNNSNNTNTISSTSNNNSDVSVTTNSYYSPHSQFSQSNSMQSMGSLSPLSLNSNSYLTLPHTQSNKASPIGKPKPSNNKYNTTNDIIIRYCNYRKYHFSDKQSAKFSLQVFVAMHTTRQLAWYTQHEPWGDKNSLLFKYLDYTFRCAAFRDEVYTFEQKQNNHNNKVSYDDEYNSGENNILLTNDDKMNGINRTESRLVFNTGLIARQSGRTIYLMLTPNQKKSVAQQWRVGYGDPYNRYNSSFVTDIWLLKHVLPNGNKALLPKQFILNSDLFYQIKHKFQKNKLQIEADFDHIVTKYWDRIIGEYNKRPALNVPSKEETTKLLKKAFDLVRRDKKKHELLTPMLYVDSHNTQHSVEYMVPLPINIPIRNHNKNRHRIGNNHSHHNGYETIWFAAALVSRERNHAQLMSILSADMAYSNARLIGSVKTPWLRKLSPLYHKLESQLSHKITSVLKVYHIECRDDDDIERLLYHTFNKYGKIVSVNISLVSSPNENDLNPSDKFSASVRFVNSHSVIEAYNGTMDALNRGCKVGFELDFELIKEMEERERSSNNENNNGCVSGCNTCQFSMIFSRPHILPPPDQLLSATHDIGPFYPINRINHECSHCHNSNINNISDNVSHVNNTNNINHRNITTNTIIHTNQNNITAAPITPTITVKHNNNSNSKNNNGYYNHNSKYKSQRKHPPKPIKYINNNYNNKECHTHNNSNNSNNQSLQVRVSVINNNNHPNYRILYKGETDHNILCESLRTYGINMSYIKYVRRCIKHNKIRGIDNSKINNKSTTDTILWYHTSPSLASQIASNGFIFKFMTDFSKLMDTSGFKFEANPNINKINNKFNHSINSHTEIHLFQCKLRLTDKQLGYLRHNNNIIITDTRIISPNYWIVLCKK